MAAEGPLGDRPALGRARRRREGTGPPLPLPTAAPSLGPLVRSGGSPRHLVPTLTSQPTGLQPKAEMGRPAPQRAMGSSFSLAPAHACPLQRPFRGSVHALCQGLSCRQRERGCGWLTGSVSLVPKARWRVPEACFLGHRPVSRSPLLYVVVTAQSPRCASPSRKVTGAQGHPSLAPSPPPVVFRLHSPRCTWHDRGVSLTSAHITEPHLPAGLS